MLQVEVWEAAATLCFLPLLCLASWAASRLDRRSKVRPAVLSSTDDVLELQVLISWLLARVRDSVPGLGSLAGAALKYLPEYQQVYFYVWN